MEGGEGGVEFVDGCLELGGSFFAEASKGSLREGERVLRDEINRYPCKERGFSEMGETVTLAGREGSPRWERLLSLLGERVIRDGVDGYPC